MNIFMNFDRQMVAAQRAPGQHLGAFLRLGYNSNSSNIKSRPIRVPKLHQIVSMFWITTIKYEHLHQCRNGSAGIGLHESMVTIVCPLERFTAFDHSFDCPALCMNQHAHFGTSVLDRKYFVDAGVIPINVVCWSMVSIVEEVVGPDNINVRPNDVSHGRHRHQGKGEQGDGSGSHSPPLPPRFRPAAQQQIGLHSGFLGAL